MFDLGRIRKENPHKISQDDLARELSRKLKERGGKGEGISQERVSQLEKDSSGISYEVLDTWLEVLGTSIDKEKNKLRACEIKQKENVLVSKNPYLNLINTTKKVREYVGRKFISNEITESLNFGSAEFLHFIDSITEKPNVALLGFFNSGKSTAINYLLGLRLLPESFIPTTSLNIILKHKDDKPEWVSDTDDVFVLSKGFDINNFNDGNYTAKYLEEGYKGPISCLQEFKHKGKTEYFKLDRASCAIAFVNADILKVCNLIDTPGFGNSVQDSGKAEKLYKETTIKRDEETSESLQFKVDIVIFPYSIQSGLNQFEVAILKNVIQNLPNFSEKVANTFNNLFILTTHIHEKEWVKVNNDHGSFYNYALERSRDLAMNLSDLLEVEEDKLMNVFAERFFPFNPDLEYLEPAMKLGLIDYLQNDLPPIKLSMANNIFVQTRDANSNKFNDEILRLKDLFDKKEEIEKWLISYKEREPKNVIKITAGKTKVKDKISNLKEKQLRDLEVDITEVCSVENLMDLIDRHFNNHKKEAESRFPSFIGSKIEAKIKHKSKKYSDELKIVIDEFFAEFENLIKPKDGVGKVSFSIPIDVKAAFIGGMASVGVAGALSMWLAGLGNLGGYIATAKVVSFLSSIGISVGGTSTAVSFVSALGGPVTFVIMLSLLAGFAVWRLFSDSWEKRLSKKINKEFLSGDSRNNFNRFVSKFWEDTQISFDAGVDEMVKELNKQVKKMEEEIKDWNPDKTEKQIQECEEFLNFLAHIPWSISDKGNSLTERR